MIRARSGFVTSVRQLPSGVLEVNVVCEGRGEAAICYPELTGPVVPGDSVILNTNALELRLGTGGYHFVMWVEGRECWGDINKPGHIIKARYTPFQVRCFTAEEEVSDYHKILKYLSSIHGLPVVVCELHSMIAPAAAGIKEIAGDEIKVVYIMTDGGGLPVMFSKLVSDLRDRTLIDTVITCGHAFGGDFDTINVYSALCVAKECAQADVVIISMGPGQVGTGTMYGFSGIEQGQVINAVYSLGGTPILVPRISFSETRKRHFGVSHHTMTVLEKVVLVPCIIVLPEISLGKWAFIKQCLNPVMLDKRRILITEGGIPAIERLQRDGINVTTMGRTVREDPEFFLSPGAAGVFAGKLALEMRASV
ncbi:MAG: DUF3866 family protein [Firmicutes bacterium]|nr:DUF3866 family protein [Bacillota bacterium]